MTYSTELAAISRRPQKVVVINLDYCDNTFGSAPCTATGTGDAKCYNTRSTCKDSANFTNTVGKDYKFSLNEAPLPFQGETIRPYLAKDPSYLPTEIDPKKAVTVNSRVTMDFHDEPDNDVGIDPYVSGRSAYPDAPGTFFLKLLARNPYYTGRKVTIKSGFRGLVEGDYKSSRYILDQIKRLDNGGIRIICKDPLKWADRVQIPAPTSGKVTDNPLSSSATTVNCDDTTDYTSSGWVRLKNEIIKYTGKTGTSFTGCTRGEFDTTAAEHKQNEKIQQCYVKEDTNVVDIILDIDQNHVGIVAADIDTTEFNAEKAAWLTQFTFTLVKSKPQKASEILTELLEQCTASQWWSEEDQKLRFKVIAPDIGTYDLLTDQSNNIKVHVDDNEKSRISRVVVYYNKDAIGDIKKPESYANAYIDWDVDAESADEYNESAIKTIYATGILTETIASVVASRYRRRFRNPAKKATVTLELKDSGIKTADFINLQTRYIQDVDGTEKARIYQVLKKRQKSPGQVEYTMLDTAWELNYGFIAPAGQPDWDGASSAQKLYAYIGDANNKLGTAKEDGFYIF
jgi:hypothetical protein